MQRFRGGLVFKANRLCVSLNSRLESRDAAQAFDQNGFFSCLVLRQSAIRQPHGCTGKARNLPESSRGLALLPRVRELEQRGLELVPLLVLLLLKLPRAPVKLPTDQLPPS